MIEHDSKLDQIRYLLSKIARTNIISAGKKSSGVFLEKTRDIESHALHVAKFRNQILTENNMSGTGSEA